MQGPNFRTGTGAAGLSQAAAYNPTYAAALYGAAFGASGTYDPAVYPAPYAGLAGFPAAAYTHLAAASDYPRGGYPVSSYGTGREANIHLQGMQGSQNKEVF